MKGIAAIIATILMLMITIGLTGTAYLYISGFFGSRTSVVLSFDQASNCNANAFTVYVRNDGTGVANNINIDLTFPNGKKLTSVCSISTITAGGSNSTACPRIGRSATGGTYSVRAYGNGATAFGTVYCGSDSSNPGLVGYWKFDEGGGITTVDSSGNGNTGTLLPAGSEPQWVNGKFNKGLQFDGVNDYVDVGNGVSLSPSNFITIAGWVYLRSGGGKHFDSSPITKGWTYTSLGFDNSATPLQLAQLKTSVNGLLTIHGDTVASLDNWHYSSLTYDGQTIRIYLDGKQTASQSASGTIVYNTGVDWWIGANNYGGYDFSAIDEVQIWNRALTQTEITELYNS
jgi:hypothetical protein